MVSIYLYHSYRYTKLQAQFTQLEAYESMALLHMAQHTMAISLLPLHVTYHTAAELHCH